MGKYNNIDVVSLELDGEINRDLMRGLLDIDELRSLAGSGYELDTYLIVTAAKVGNLEVFMYLVDQCYIWQKIRTYRQWVISDAVRNNHLDIVYFLCMDRGICIDGYLDDKIIEGLGMDFFRSYLVRYPCRVKDVVKIFPELESGFGEMMVIDDAGLI